MASGILSQLYNLWPLSALKTDDLKVSARLVKKLPIPDHTKPFVFAFQVPNSNAVVYVLAGQKLSEQSALDAECLIKAVLPKAVVGQVGLSALAEIQDEEKLLEDDQAREVPTSYYEVLKACVINKINKEQYEKLAGCQVLRAIFGVGFSGHLLTAKRAAAEVDSHFLLLESPYESACSGEATSEADGGGQSFDLCINRSSFLPGNVSFPVYSNSRRFCLTDNVQAQMVKALTPYLDPLFSNVSSSNSVSKPDAGKSEPEENYQAPPFAQPFYSLLEDLHFIFINLQSMGRALVSAQKMLVDVNKGDPVDTQLLSEVQNFRIAVEGLRIALNNAGRLPINKQLNGNSASLEFSELPSEEKCHALFAQTIRSQAVKFGTVVAIVDAAKLDGLRRHWTTTLPPEIAELANQCLISHAAADVDAAQETIALMMDRKKTLLADKPVVAVGAGASAVLGASSLAKAFPASTLAKVATYNASAAIKLGLAHLKRTAAIGLSKILGSSKVIAPGMATTGTKASALKYAVSSEKIRTVTHTVIATAQRTSLLAMRTSFYELMRRGYTQPVRFVPWATFGVSMAACGGLLKYGGGIECAAESIPSVPMVASLGRGLESLHQASQEVRLRNSTRLQETVESLMLSLKKIKISE